MMCLLLSLEDRKSGAGDRWPALKYNAVFSPKRLEVGTEAGGRVAVDRELRQFVFVN